MTNLRSGKGGVIAVADATILIAACVGFSLWRVGPETSTIFRPGGLVGVGILALSTLFSVAAMGGYRLDPSLRNLLMAAEFLTACIAGLVISLFVMHVLFLGTEIQSQSRMVYVFASMAFIPAGLGIRFALEWFSRSVSVTRPILFIGSAPAFQQFEAFVVRSGIRSHVEGILIDGEEGFRPVWNVLSEAPSRFEALVLDNDLKKFPEELLHELMRLHFNKLPVLRMRAYLAAMRRQIPALDIDADWIFGRDFHLAAHSPYLTIKRVADTGFAAVALVALAPVLLVIAMAIKLSDGGPIFFNQKRVGLGGHVFQIWKFRSMVVGAERGEPYTRPNDVRVTRLGSLLRKLRVDELPQLFNILKGDMSLIGPRPEWERLVTVYEREIPYYHLRHLVKPGLTGWAQLNQSYGESLQDAIEKLRFDLYYIEYCSPILDLEILLKTALHLFFLRGR